MVESESCGASKCVAEQVIPGEGSAQNSGQKPVVLKTKQSKHVEILTELDTRSKKEDPQRERPDSGRKDNPAEAAQQQGYEQIAYIWADKAVMYEQCNIDFNSQEYAKDGSVQESSGFYHMLTTCYKNYIIYQKQPQPHIGLRL